MWQTPTLLQRCRHRRWWPARKKKQLEAVVVVVAVGANGPVVTSLRPRWCQRLAIAAAVAAAAGQAVRRCAPDPPPKTKHLHHPETSQDIITTITKSLLPPKKMDFSTCNTSLSSFTLGRSLKSQLETTRLEKKKKIKETRLL